MQKVKIYRLDCDDEFYKTGECYLNMSQIVYGCPICGEHLEESNGKFARIYLTNEHSFIVECSVLDSYTEN